MDLTFLYLAGGFIVSALYFEFRLRRLLKNIAPRALALLQSAFFDENEVESEDGMKRVLLRPNARLRGLMSAVIPGLVAEAIKNVKLKLPTGGVLPAGIDVTNLSEMLPAILPMIPKKYQGIAALAMPFLGPLLGGIGKPGGKGKETPNPFLKELSP